MSAKPFGEKVIVKNFTATILRGDKVGTGRAQRHWQDDAAETDPR